MNEPFNGQPGTEIERRIDDSLRRLFEPPDQRRLDELGEHAMRQYEAEAPRPLPYDAAPPRTRRRFLAAAAGIAAAALGGWLIYDAMRPAHGLFGNYTPQPWRSFATVYRDRLSDGFEPAWVCETDEEFGGTFAAALQQPVLLGPLPAGVTALGLDYCHSLTPQTILVLASVQGDPVLVFIDRIERDAPQAAPEGLFLHRRQLGGLVLYELTPREEPALLEHFYTPEGPASTKR